MTPDPRPHGEAVDLSEHAVERFRERLRPALDHPAARAELAALMAAGEIVSDLPAWARSVARKPFYLLIGDAVALPLAAQSGRWVTTTCLVKSTPPRRRRARQARRRALRAAMRGRRHPAR